MNTCVLLNSFCEQIQQSSLHKYTKQPIKWVNLYADIYKEMKVHEIMYIEVRQHNFVYLRNINKVYFTKKLHVSAVAIVRFIFLNYSGMVGLPDYEISLSVLLGSS
jgi:transcription termination factor Rho